MGKERKKKGYERVYTIGLTGGIATGKSTASAFLKELGADIIDADAISRASTQPEGEAAPAVLKRFGTLNRKELGKIVFSDPQARRDLEEIVHPVVIRQVRKRMQESPCALCVLDVPLLFETGMDELTDEVWVTYVPEEEQVRRICQRDGLDEAAALARIRAQMPTQEKIRRAQVAVDTSGSIEETQEKLQAAWKQALQRVEEKK